MPGTKSIFNDDINTGAINSRTIKNNNIKSKDIRHGTITAADLTPDALTTGPAGTNGTDGATGPAGTNGTDGATGPAGATGDSGTDTMGTLSCAGDQVALFDGAVWACKTAVLVRSVGMTTNTALETAGDVGRFSSVAIGLDGNPIIAHTDYTNGDLEFVTAYFMVTGIAYQ